MSQLKNPKHELFCRLVAQGVANYKAYMDAGYVISPVAARAASGRLLSRNDVPNRIHELKGIVAERILATRIVLDKASLIEHVYDILIRAKAAQDWNAALRAAELLGREFGAFTEKKEVTHVVSDLDDLSLPAMLKIAGLARFADDPVTLEPAPLLIDHDPGPTAI